MRLKEINRVSLILMLFFIALLLACACTPPVPSQSRSQSQRISDRTQPLGEFEPLSPGDVELYLKVMRAAAERLKNLSRADREALAALRNTQSNPGRGQMISAEQIAAISRTTELMSMDSVIAKEMGISKRYQSVSARVPLMSMGRMTGEGDASDDPPMTEEQKRERKLRIERFRLRNQLDDAALAPHREEILSLQKQVCLSFFPESIPK